MCPDSLIPEITKTVVRAVQIANALQVVPCFVDRLVTDVVFEHLSLLLASFQE